LPFAAGGYAATKVKIGGIPTIKESYSVKRFEEIVEAIREPRRIVDLRKAYYKDVLSRSEWKDYESLVRLGRYDLIEKRYPTIEPPTQQSIRIIKGEELKAPEKITVIPEEWYGKFVPAEFGERFSRVGIGGARSRIVLPKDILPRELIDYGASTNNIQELHDVFPYGRKSKIVLGEELRRVERGIETATKRTERKEGKVTVRKDIKADLKTRWDAELNRLKEGSNEIRTAAGQRTIQILKQEEIKPLTIQEYIQATEQISQAKVLQKAELVQRKEALIYPVVPVQQMKVRQVIVPKTIQKQLQKVNQDILQKRIQIHKQIQKISPLYIIKPIQITKIITTQKQKPIQELKKIQVIRQKLKQKQVPEQIKKPPLLPKIFLNKVDRFAKRIKKRGRYVWDIRNPVPTLESILGE